MECGFTAYLAFFIDALHSQWHIQIGKAEWLVKHCLLGFAGNHFLQVAIDTGIAFLVLKPTLPIDRRQPLHLVAHLRYYLLEVAMGVADNSFGSTYALCLRQASLLKPLAQYPIKNPRQLRLMETNQRLSGFLLG